MSAPASRKIAFLFRYGPAEHTELFHCIPEIIAGLARNHTVHYYGLKSRKPVPETIRQNAVLYLLPINIDRTNSADKIFKTFIWLCLLPCMALHCRITGMDAVYIDETLPLSAFLAKIFFGRRIAITVTDFFLNIYGSKFRFIRPLAGIINRIDFFSWRRITLIFTRARSTRDYLIAQGVAPGKIVPIYDPCDTSLYRPIAKADCRKRFGFSEDDVVLVHHGILHPNKGNDVIIRALPEILRECPCLRFLLIGDGPEMQRLRSLVKELNLEKTVIFTGWLPRLADVNCALNAGDIGLVMRLGMETDHFAMTGTLIHNLACGLPVLAARLSSIEEVIKDGENGFLFSPDNMDEFRTKLLKLANNAILRQEFANKALQVVHEYFDMKKVAEQTIATLTKLCLE
jgi:glycosyltransferase involved in cell wall biosynthesis